MTGRKLGLYAGLALVVGFVWMLVSQSLSGGAAGTGGLRANLVVDGQTYPDRAAIYGSSGAVSVDGLVQALGGTVERVGATSETEWEYAIIALKGKRLVLYSGKVPDLPDPTLVFVNETGRHTAPDLGWYWTQAEVKDFLKLVYPRLLVATNNSAADPGVFIETDPVQ